MLVKGGDTEKTSKVALVMLSIASLGTGLLTWAFTQNAYLGLVSGGVTGGRLAASIATLPHYLTEFYETLG